MVIETGASIDIIDELAFNTLQKQRPIVFQRSKTRIFAYGATNQLPVTRQFHATLECLTGATTTQVHVIKGNFDCLLSYQTASALGLIMLNVNNVKPGHATHEQLMEEYCMPICSTELALLKILKLNCTSMIRSLQWHKPPVVFLSTCGKRSQMRSTR